VESAEAVIWHIWGDPAAYCTQALVFQKRSQRLPSVDVMKMDRPLISAPGADTMAPPSGCPCYAYAHAMGYSAARVEQHQHGTTHS
jgi:hypothetical protein